MWKGFERKGVKTGMEKWNQNEAILTCLKAPSLWYSGYRVSFLDVKQPGRLLTTHPHLTPRLKKE
jgi:hypothetical protein